MIVIVEGENKTGKTTLCNYLTDKYQFKYLKFSQPEIDPYIEYMEALQLVQDSYKVNWVFDRFCLGEPVYGEIYRGVSSLTEAQVRNIQLKAMSLNALVIYCYDTVANLTRRFKDDKEDFADISKIQATLSLFEKQLEKTFIPTIRHQMMTSCDLLKNDVDHSALKFLIDDSQKHFNIFRTGVGNLSSPAIVFIGDKHNDNVMPQYKRYYQPFDFGSSSRSLFDALSKANVTLDKVAIFNSDSVELKLYLSTLKPYVTVVALGLKAAETLTTLKVDKFYQLPHPQYENGFHCHISEFIPLLKRIANV